MVFLSRMVAVFIVTFAQEHELMAQLRLNPPWITVIQEVNENYYVKCEGEGEKMWKHNNGQISNDRVGSQPSVTVVKKPQDNSLHLRFNKIQKEFKGFYNCTSTVKGEKHNVGFKLIVIKPVEFLTVSKMPEIKVYNEGDDVILHCDTEGEPPPIISWFFNNALVSNTNNIHILPNNTLTIDNTTWRNSGTYICRAFQKILQTRDAELLYEVKIRHKPISYTGRLQTTVYGFRNERRNITCQVDAYPVAYFIWYRDNVPIDPRKFDIKIYNEENRSILEMPLTSANVLGTYNCEAANPLGLLIQQTDVQLINKPATPTLLVYEYNDTSAIISVVIEPYPLYDFICLIDCTMYTYCTYEEKWRRGFNVECKNDRIKNANKTHCKIDNLKPLTKYAVRATIVNSGGSGNFSKQLIFRTRKEMSSLLSLSVTVVSNTCLIISSLLILIKITDLKSV